jgi:homoserine dehydrogenase
LALLGFGNVGQALIELLLEKMDNLQEDVGISFRVVAAASGSHGIAIDPLGFSLEKLLESYRQGITLDEISQIPVSDSQEFIQKCAADVLFETTPVNYQDGQPALDYIRAGLENGMHVITANKGPVVHGYRELSGLAKKNGVRFLFESAVMDGAPIFSIARSGLPGARINALSGILNSTTNLILTRMEKGETLDESIRYAQSIGIAETDPSGDVDGWDAAVKVAALVTVMMNIPLKPDQVERNGIRGITPDMIQDSLKNGNRWKLVCSARIDDQAQNGLIAKVQPQQVDQTSPFYNIMGTTSILQITSDVLGKLSIIEEDPSPKTTAYGLLADFLNAVQS